MHKVHPDHVTADDIAAAEEAFLAANTAHANAHDAWRAALEADALCAPLLAAYWEAQTTPRSGTAWRVLDDLAVLRAPRECDALTMVLAAKDVASRRLSALRAAYARQTAATQEVAQ